MYNLILIILFSFQGPFINFISFWKENLQEENSTQTNYSFSQKEGVYEEHVPAQKWIDTHFKKEVTEINASGQDLEGNINFSAFTKLEKINLDNNYNIYWMNVHDNRELKWFSANNSFHYYMPDLTDNPKLEYLSLNGDTFNYNNPLESRIDLKNNQRLNYLDFRGIYDPWNKDKNLEVWLAYNFHPDTFLSNTPLNIEYFFKKINDKGDQEERNLTAPQNWKLFVFENAEQPLTVTNNGNHLIWNNDNSTWFYKPSEKWATDPFEGGAYEHRYVKGLKNWYDLDRDVPQGTSKTFGRFFYWIYRSYLGYQWIVPLWYESPNFLTPIQNWLDQQDANSTILEARGMNFTGHADLSRFSKLETLDLFYNKITSVDLSHNLKLQFLFLNDNLLKTIDVSFNPLLYIFHAENNLTKLFIRLHWKFNDHWYLFYHDDDAIIERIKQPEQDAQKWLNQQYKKVPYLQGTNLNLVGKINFQGFTEIETLWLFNNNLQEIDVSACQRLKVLWTQNNPPLKKIILPYGFDINNKDNFKYDNDHEIEIIIH